jgi:CheY-like chemotaxis protein/two-component sensor histidine kinase
VTDRPAQRDLAGVLHDVSNALTVVLGWVGEARAEGATPDAVAYALTIIDQRARVARDLARQAIGATRIEEPEPALALTNDVVSALKVEASRAGVVLDREGSADGEVCGALDLSQVLSNLVLNAIAFAPKGTAVTVRLAQLDGVIEWIVEDRGPGVPADKRDAIFEGTSLRSGGIGVGLRHARALARAWGGDVELVSSEAGGCFRIRWPRFDAIPRPPVSVSRMPTLEGLRILLVEDDVAVTQLVETALDARGAEVVVAANPAELDRALATPFDAALIDLSPLGADIAGALRRMRAAGPSADLVLITGSADRLPEIPEAEGMKLVRKPFELSELLAALKNRT